MNHSKPAPVLLALTLLALCAPRAGVAQPARNVPRAGAPGAAPPKPPFIVGVWYQPMSSFAKWKARGINTLVGIETEGNAAVAPADYVKAAHAMGFYVIGKDIAADAWEQPDEPDGAGNQTPDQVVANYKLLKSKADKPVLLNFDGGKVLEVKRAADHEAYAGGADWLGFDWYPCNNACAADGPVGIAKCLDQLVPLGKPVLVFIETSDQDRRVQDWLHTKENQPLGEQMAAAMRGPTADEMAAQVGVALAHGAAGLIYFPDVIGKGWEGFDGTPDDVAAGLTCINQTLAASPGGAGGATPAAAAAGAATDPLAGKVITIDGRRYRLGKTE